MNHVEEKVENGASCAAPSGVGSDDWQALEWQLMSLALATDEEGAEQ
ncbi:hypothetical protein [Pseudomonas sp. BN417]|nr:hypothetical protein [Pseudomonas sp. BN417]